MFLFKSLFRPSPLVRLSAAAWPRTSSCSSGRLCRCPYMKLTKPAIHLRLSTISANTGTTFNDQNHPSDHLYNVIIIHYFSIEKNIVVLNDLNASLWRTHLLLFLYRETLYALYVRDSAAPPPSDPDFSGSCNTKQVSSSLDQTGKTRTVQSLWKLHSCEL